jgi:SpoIVB peptidase S55
MGRGTRAGRWCGVLLVVGLTGAAPLVASPALFPSSQIAVGMTGIGKTVLLGTKISEFPVTILGVLRNAGPAGDLVLFRASGPVIQTAGGLASGMSGSPIYLGGRLAGAFSYSFQFADPMVGLFTPIEDMMKVFPVRTRGPRPGVYPVTPFSLDGRIVRRVELRASPDSGPGAADTAVAVPAATPLFVSGLGDQATDEMTAALRPMGLLPMAGPGTADLPSTIPLEPGSAIGVALMRGDLSAYAIGTLTYRDGNRILAFGHPFTELGRTEFLLTNATILQTLRAWNHNLKVGASGAPVGTVTEDRPAAVGGTIGVLPRMFGVRVTVRDADQSTSRRFGFQVVASKDLAPILVALGTRGAVERALNRSGEGTAEVRIALRGRGLPRRVERANLFYSGSDISIRALAEVPQALHLLFENDFADVGPADISIDLRITGVRQTGTITEAEFPKGPLQPGGSARVRVTVRPFREAAVTRDVDLAVPSDFPEGPAVLTVRAGSIAPPLGPGGTPPPGPGPVVIRNLADAISMFEDGDKNTDVVVDLVSGAQRPPLGSSAGPPRVTTRWTSPWVLGGRFQTPIMIGRGAR